MEGFDSRMTEIEKKKCSSKLQDRMQEVSRKQQKIKKKCQWERTHQWNMG